MRLFSLVVFLFAFCSSFAVAQWQEQAIRTQANLRGLSVVSSSVAWISGRKGPTVEPTTAAAHGTSPQCREPNSLISVMSKPLEK